MSDQAYPLNNISALPQVVVETCAEYGITTAPQFYGRYVSMRGGLANLLKITRVELDGLAAMVMPHVDPKLLEDIGPTPGGALPPGYPDDA